MTDLALPLKNDEEPPQGGYSSLPQHVPLAITTRGGKVENIHHGSVAIATAQGQLIAGIGDAEALVFTRSTLKPVQALALLSHPEVKRLQLSEKNIAMLCASHSGEAFHLQALQQLAQRTGIAESQLQCGGHPPLGKILSGKLPQKRREYRPWMNNCAGKHIGFLSACQLHGWDCDTYLDLEHPLQQKISQLVSYFADTDHWHRGIDGCNAPNYALPLRHVAAMYGRLASDETDSQLGTVPQQIFQAMTQQPLLVSGHHREDYQLMHCGKGDIVAKFGADALQALGSKKRQLGIAIKIADGSMKILAVVAAHVLRQLRLIEADAASALAPSAVVNFRGTPTGEHRVLFHL